MVGQRRHPLGNTIVALTLLTGLLAGSPSLAAPYPSLEYGLTQHAKDILEHCRQKENPYRHLGVLRFVVKKEGEKASSNVGPLNLNLARRLEIALILANKNDDPVVILREASLTVAKIKGADHEDRRGDGRRLLFEDKEGKPRKVFTPAWGDPAKKVAADAFVVGRVKFKEDAEGPLATVQLFLLSGKTRRLSLVSQYDARPTLRTLIESGESFQLRGFNDRRRGGTFEEVQVEEVKAASASAREIKTGKATNPVEAGTGVTTRLPDATSTSTPPPAVKDPRDLPVELVIKYDGKPQKIELLGGKAQIAEPREDQRVTFELTRKDRTTAAKYAVVLMINGLNTLGKEHRPPEKCLKWVFSPDQIQPIAITGYYPEPEKLAQLGEGKEEVFDKEQFRVSSPEESESNEVKYGEHCGQITLVIFKENPAKKEPERLLDQEFLAKKVEVVTNAEHPDDLPAEDLVSAKEQLLKQPTASRGLIEGGARSKEALRKVPLQPLDVVTSVTITYYKKP